MSDPQLTQTNYFGRNDRGAQIGHLENFFNLPTHRESSSSKGGSDVDVENRCLRSLASRQIYMDRQNGKRVPGTGDWVLENDVYKAWQQNGGILWIKGRAGCGKSMLINHLSSEAKRKALEISDTTVLSHSFVFGKAEPLQRSPAGLYRGLLHQILAMDRDLLTHFTKTTNFAARERQQGQAGAAWDWSPSELQEQLDDICRHKFCQPGKAYVYVDCLDACSDEYATEILEWLISLTSEAGNGFRICFSSRPYPKWKLDNLVCLNLEEMNQSDMVSYLDFHLEKLQQPFLRGYAVKEEDLLLIKGRLLDRASSVFQWLKYAIRQATGLLQSGESVSYVLDTLDKCPQDLDDVYASIVELIPRQETDVAFRLLEWITLAQAPLPVEDLRHAICIDRPYKKRASVDDFRTPNKHWCEKDDLLVSRAERLTRGLVRLHKVVLMDPNPGFGISETKVQVIQCDHESVQEFFANRGLQILARRMGTDFVISSSHLRLTQRCLAYLLTREGMSTAIKQARAQHAESLELFAGSSEGLNQEIYASVQDDLNAAILNAEEEIPSAVQLRLTKYAAQYWKQHYRLAESETAIIDDCSAFLHSVCGPDLWKVEIWYHLPCYYLHTKRPDERNRTVDLICSLGFVNTLNRLISRPIDESEHTTAPGGLRDVLNKKSPYGQTPLIAAIRGRWRGIVELLLQHGVSANVQDCHGFPPMYYAVLTGQADVVDLLLASPDIDPDKGGNRNSYPLMTALHWAVENDGAEELQILESLVRSTKQNLHSIANTVCFPDPPPTPESLEVGWPHIPLATPLAVAWLSASGNVLKILLKCPLIDSSAHDRQGRTLAHYIAAYKLTVLPNISTEKLDENSRILFDSGRIALDAKDSEGHTPLAIAVKTGDSYIVSILLAKEEVDANSKNNRGHTPFLIASQDGKVGILKILLASERVNRHEVDNIGRDALVNAVIGGCFEAVGLLMSTGQFNPHEQPVGGFSPVESAFVLTQDPNQGRKAERVRIYEFLTLS